MMACFKWIAGACVAMASFAAVANAQGVLLKGDLGPSIVGAARPTASYADPVGIEAENLSVPAGIGVVDDAKASGGKAFEIHAEKKKTGSDQVKAGFPAAESAGRYALTLRLYARDMYDLGRGWRVEIKTGGDTVAWDVLHGYHFKGATGYREFTIPFELRERGLVPAVSMFWAGEDTSKPAIRIDRVEVQRTGELPALQITKVWPDKIRYRTDEDGTIAVAFRNSTARELEGEVKIDLIHDLETARVIGARSVRLPAGEAGQFSLPLRHGGGRFGYEVRATASVRGKVVDRASEHFCVSDNPFEVATHANRFSDGEYDRKDYWMRGTRAEEVFPAMIEGRWDQLKRVTMYSIRNWLDLSASDEDLAECAVQARRAYTTMWEVYAWSPGGCLDMAPKEPVWPCGDDSRWLYSKRHIIRTVAALKKHGIGVVSYIIPFGQGLASLRLQKEHPEWFCNGPGMSPTINDSPGVAEMNMAKKVRQFNEALQSAPRSDWPKFQQKALALSHVGYYGLNWNRAEVLDYVESQMIASIRMFDWDGLRWDCGHLNTGRIYPQIGGPWKPHTDYQGKPLCQSADEMVAQTVAHLRHFKARIRSLRPNFCFGTNFGWFREIEQYPKMVEELARNGGWFLDEPATRYSWPEYRVVTWKKYYKTMADQGEYLTSLGGHYNPYGLRPRTPSGGVALYCTVFGLAGHSHPEQFFRSKCFPIGDTAQFAVRFGRFLFDAEFRRIKTPEKVVAVESPQPVWWEESVLRKRGDASETWVIHLINPPVSEPIEGNIAEPLRPPIGNVKVSLKIPDGKDDVRAWVLMSEAWKFGDRPMTQAVRLAASRADGKVTVSVPEILFWKVLVFQFGV